jgi:hypothetical protein
MLHRRRRHRRPSSRLRYLLAAPLVALSLGSGLAPAVTAQAAVACVPDFSNVAGVNLDETTSCGSTTTEVAANVGGFATLSPNDQFVARWDNTYHGHAYVQAVDGSGTVDLGEGISPAWAPDNSRVALTTTDYQGTTTLDVVGRDGGGHQTILTETDGSDSYPAWSPDGTKIATVHYDTTSFRYSVYAQDATGGNRRMLTEAPTDATISGAPTWAPDGNSVVYTMMPSMGQFGLYVVSLDGGNAVQVPTLAGGQAWGATFARNWALGYISDIGGPHFVVQNAADPTGAFQFPYVNSFSMPEFRPRGTDTPPPATWPPRGVRTARWATGRCRYR